MDRLRQNAPAVSSVGRLLGLLPKPVRGRSPGQVRSGGAPHAIPAGREGSQCPITGLSFEQDGRFDSALAARAEMDADPDIAEERAALEQHGGADDVRERAPVAPGQKFAEPLQIVPLSVIDGKHVASSLTRRLVQALGGLPVLRRFTTAFYKKAFADPHIDKFIRSHEDPHGERFALWIAEKLGDGTPWTQERRTRPRTVLRLGHEAVQVSFDRSSAHFAAWHSPKREAHKWGEHFKLDDARVWMRLHFWAARETGILEHQAFADYYVRFIAHFISIYSSKSPAFTRDSLRWSADPRNVQLYLGSGRMMRDVIDVPLEQALNDIPPEERLYSGSRHVNATWPYELSPRG